jgi:hypothetical protein
MLWRQTKTETLPRSARRQWPVGPRRRPPHARSSRNGSTQVAAPSSAMTLACSCRSWSATAFGTPVSSPVRRAHQSLRRGRHRPGGSRRPRSGRGPQAYSRSPDRWLRARAGRAGRRSLGRQPRAQHACVVCTRRPRHLEPHPRPLPASPPASYDRCRSKQRRTRGEDLVMNPGRFSLYAGLGQRRSPNIPETHEPA